MCLQASRLIASNLPHLYRIWLVHSAFSNFKSLVYTASDAYHIHFWFESRLPTQPAGRFRFGAHSGIVQNASQASFLDRAYFNGMMVLRRVRILINAPSETGL